MIASSRWS
ncbi:hypothetical protein Ahy_A04g020954 isoform B [Arachis hypogaea]|uniref:Uncharacterized protein n=1 Tax=Arachis hypogaea TaxID=3818 RepID=A0A445DIZ3_ARAHY|nr:hypothetical protein Ahy_A04g020954 isoform B [Arachis hypogaea]